MGIKKNKEKVNLKTKINFIKIVLHQKLKKEDLKEFFDYIEHENIKEVENVEEADLVLSFGGDGTMLEAAKETFNSEVPIMAINMGTLGYLAEVNPKDVIEMMENYKTGNYVIDERNLLEIGYNGVKYYALNEMVVIKGGLMARLIEVEVFDNGIFVNKYRADGVIVSTPTGSTAYSLAAGGSIVHPSLDALIITPLSPHSLTTRPIVVSGKQKLNFKISSRDDDAHLNLDGRVFLKVDPKDEVSATLSEKKVKIIRSGKKDYYNILREKLKWGESSIK